VPGDGTQALILVLPYGGEPTGFYGRPLIEQLIGPGLAELDAVMVAPVSLGSDWRREDNERAVLALFEMIERTYNTDRARRVITGYSMGGIGTWYLIERHPQYFSAAIPISGYAGMVSGCTTPVYALHSTSDSIFGLAGLQDLIETLTKAGCNARLETIEGVDHYNVPAFAVPLKNTVPWVREVWQQAGGSQGS